MLSLMKKIVLGSGLLLWTSASFAQSLPPYNPVTQERLLNPEESNWLMYRGTYDAHGYSTLDQINIENVD